MDDPDPNLQTDLATYRAQYGLPPCLSGCFTQENYLGGPAYTKVPASMMAIVPVVDGATVTPYACSRSVAP